MEGRQADADGDADADGERCVCELRRWLCVQLFVRRLLAVWLLVARLLVARCRVESSRRTGRGWLHRKVSRGLL